MIVEKEDITYQHPVLSVKVFDIARKMHDTERWHYHKEIEILTIHEGSLEVHVDDEIYTLREGDSVLIGINQLHRDRSDSNTWYTVLQLDLEPFFDQSMLRYLHMFTDNSVPLSRLNYILAENEEARETVYRNVTSIFEEFRDKRKGFEIAVIVSVKQMLLTLLRSDRLQVLGGTPGPEFDRLRPALEYIESNIREKMSVEDVCRQVNLSYYYFVKLFAKTMGMSFTDYVNYRKIKLAEKMLLTRNWNIANVGEYVGLANMAHFYKLFQRYHRCSPNEFRKKMADWSGRSEANLTGETRPPISSSG